jgi:hypothetical protein
MHGEMIGLHSTSKERQVMQSMATINGCHVEHQAVTERQKAVF